MFPTVRQSRERNPRLNLDSTARPTRHPFEPALTPARVVPRPFSHRPVPRPFPLRHRSDTTGAGSRTGRRVGRASESVRVPLAVELRTWHRYLVHRSSPARSVECRERDRARGARPGVSVRAEPSASSLHRRAERRTRRDPYQHRTDHAVVQSGGCHSSSRSPRALLRPDGSRLGALDAPSRQAHDARVLRYHSRIVSLTSIERIGHEYERSDVYRARDITIYQKYDVLRG